jgi:hypothetical protein
LHELLISENMRTFLDTTGVELRHEDSKSWTFCISESTGAFALAANLYDERIKQQPSLKLSFEEVARNDRDPKLLILLAGAGYKARNGKAAECRNVLASQDPSIARAAYQRDLLIVSTQRDVELSKISAQETVAFGRLKSGTLPRDEARAFLKARADVFGTYRIKMAPIFAQWAPIIQAALVRAARSQAMSSTVHQVWICRVI